MSLQLIFIDDRDAFLTAVRRLVSVFFPETVVLLALAKGVNLS